MKEVPFFNYPMIYKRFESEFNQAFKDVCSRGAFILQDDLLKFEKELANFVGVKHAIGVADGTNAIFLGLNALGISRGDEVIISSHTYVATANAIKMVGADTVFADIADDNLLCANATKEKISTKTKAIMPTQLNGRCADMDAFKELTDLEGLFLCEDSAQGLGAKYKGQSAGTFGSFGTLSFYPAKLIGCFGDGGAVLTNDDNLAEKFIAMRDHGRNEEGYVSMWGTNSRLDNLQAAFLSIRLKYFEEDMKRRRMIAKKYIDELKDINQIKLPEGPNNESKNFDVFQNFECQAYDRDNLKKYLASKGIGTLIQWGGTPVHHFESLGFGKDKYTDLKKTDNFFEECIMLPMHMSLLDEDVDYVIDSIRSFYLNSDK